MGGEGREKGLRLSTMLRLRLGYLSLLFHCFFGSDPPRNPSGGGSGGLLHSSLGTLYFLIDNRLFFDDHCGLEQRCTNTTPKGPPVGEGRSVVPDVSVPVCPSLKRVRPSVSLSTSPPLRLCSTPRGTRRFVWRTQLGFVLGRLLF